MAPPILRLEGVRKSYAGASTPALHETDLEIRRGEFFSLLGPSGSGKTTTLRLIGGFESPDRGRILLERTDVTDRPPNQRDVNTVFQNYALFPHLSVRDNVGYPLDVRRTPGTERAGRVREALALVEMTGLEDRLPHELSGGQRQRVALARALIGRPKLLLLDEPLGALDLRLRQQMQSVLTRLQREVGITFVYVTHDHGEALAMSDRIAVMADGRVSQIGSPREVYYAPQNRFVAAFLGNSNILEGTIAAGGTRFLTEGVELALAGAHEPGPAAAAVRCENVEIVPADSPGAVPAVVTEVTFLGEVSEITARTGAATLAARVPSRLAVALAPGREVGLGIAPSDVVVLHG